MLTPLEVSRLTPEETVHIPHWLFWHDRLASDIVIFKFGLYHCSLGKARLVVKAASGKLRFEYAWPNPKLTTKEQP